MSFPELTGAQAISWLNYHSERFRDFFHHHPEALAFPCDIRETADVAGLLQHIVAAELRYAERLNDLPQTSYDAIPSDTAEAMYAVHDRAMSLLAALQQKDAQWWHETIEVATRSAGTMTAPRNVIFFHLLMHAVRHYAQLATILRLHGTPARWSMDYIAMKDTQDNN